MVLITAVKFTPASCSHQEHKARERCNASHCPDRRLKGIPGAGSFRMTMAKNSHAISWVILVVLLLPQDSDPTEKLVLAITSLQYTKTELERQLPICRGRVKALKANACYNRIDIKSGSKKSYSLLAPFVGQRRPP